VDAQDCNVDVLAGMVEDAVGVEDADDAEKEGQRESPEDADAAVARGCDGVNFAVAGGVHEAEAEGVAFCERGAAEADEEGGEEENCAAEEHVHLEEVR